MTRRPSKIAPDASPVPSSSPDASAVTSGAPFRSRITEWACNVLLLIAAVVSTYLVVSQ